MTGRFGRLVALLCAFGLVLGSIEVAQAYPLPPMSSIMMDARTGQVLYAQNADQPRYPASLTKLMTLYMLFEALRDHRITLNQLMPVSVHAASVQPVKLGMPPGSRLSVEEAILGMVTLSANDAATVAGEFLAGGDETRFGALMTLKAHTLGMDDTVFRNASGLPDPAQVTTAHDVALLARRLIQDFPDDYHYFSTPSFLFHGRVIFNHDHLLKSYPGADGMKTGYTNAAGHNLVTSALRGGVRLIGVVMAAPSTGYRDEQMAGRRRHVRPRPRPARDPWFPSLRRCPTDNGRSAARSVWPPALCRIGASTSAAIRARRRPSKCFASASVQPAAAWPIWRRCAAGPTSNGMPGSRRSAPRAPAPPAPR
jgi:D-alanyl-D-alanine carboxypeptidase